MGCFNEREAVVGGVFQLWSVLAKLKEEVCYPLPPSSREWLLLFRIRLRRIFCIGGHWS